MNERELFERFFVKTNTYTHIMKQAKYNHEVPIVMPLDRAITDSDMYQHVATHSAWEAWQASANREGCKLVPIEPTPKMIDATWDNQEEIESMSHNARNEFIYKSMLSKY